MAERECVSTSPRSDMNSDCGTVTDAILLPLDTTKEQLVEIIMGLWQQYWLAIERKSKDSANS